MANNHTNDSEQAVNGRGGVDPAHDAPQPTAGDTSGAATLRIGGDTGDHHKRGGRKPGLQLRGAFWNGESPAQGEETSPKVRGGRKKRLSKRDKAEIAAQATIAKLEQFASRMLQEPAPMDEFERMLVEPSLTSILAEMDTDALERFNWILTPGMLLFGLGLYGYSILSRASEKFPPKPKPATPIPVRPPAGKQPPPPANGKTVPPVGEDGVTNPSIFDQWANEIGLGNDNTIG